MLRSKKIKYIYPRLYVNVVELNSVAFRASENVYSGLGLCWSETECTCITDSICKPDILTVLSVSFWTGFACGQCISYLSSSSEYLS